MTTRPIGVGDRVVNMQMPVVFVVTGRRGHLLDLESDRGVRMVALESTIRRLDGPPPAPKDDAE
jgi:hypothetical protein